MPTEEAPRLQPVIPAGNKTAAASIVVPSPRQGGRLPMEPLPVRIPCPSDPPPTLLGGGGSADVLLGKKNANSTGAAQLKPLQMNSKPSPSPPRLLAHRLSSPTLQDPIFGSAPSLAKKSALVDPLPVHPASPTGSPPPTTTFSGLTPHSTLTVGGGSNILDISSTGLGIVMPPPTGSTSSGNIIGDALRPPPASKMVPGRRHHVVPPVQPVASSSADGGTTGQKEPSRTVNVSSGDTLDANALLAAKYTPVNPKTLILFPVHPTKNTEKDNEST